MSAARAIPTGGLRVLLTLPGTNHPHAFPTFADIDGDNDQDLFIGEGGWQGPNAGGNIYYYRNDGTPALPNWSLVITNYLGIDVGGWSRPVFADIDHDTDLDLFIGDEAGTLTYVRNTGTVHSATWAAPIRPFANLDVGAYSAPAFFDVDQDGDLDMLIGCDSGSLAYVRNTGTISTPSWSLVSTLYPGIDVGENSSPAAADVNGDNNPDLLLGDIDGGLNLYHYVGAGHRRRPITCTRPAISHRRAAAARPGHHHNNQRQRHHQIRLGYLMLYDAQAPIPPRTTLRRRRCPAASDPASAARELSECASAWAIFTRPAVMPRRQFIQRQIPADLPPGMYRP
jgi:hypothetical protein